MVTGSSIPMMYVRFKHMESSRSVLRSLEMQGGQTLATGWKCQGFMPYIWEKMSFLTHFDILEAFWVRKHSGIHVSHTTLYSLSL